jgi:SAM-dependent methyltransferase
MDLDTYRQASRQTWDEMSTGWEERRDWLIEMTGSVNAWIIDQVDPQPGQTILDIAAGTGDLGFAAAERVGDGGRVITTDFAPDMLDAARRNGEARGLSNVEYQVMDAERMPLGDDSVDGVVCRFGYMLMADPLAALKETRRVLRDGGTLGFAVWQTPDRNMWAAIPAMTLVQRGHMPPPEPGAPGIFALGDRGRLEEVVTGAGLDVSRIEEITFEWRYGAGDVWDTINKLAGPIAAAIKELSAQEQQETREAIEAAMEEYRDGDDLVVPAATWGVVAS